MHKHGMFRHKVQRVHYGRSSDGQVRAWQSYMNKIVIPRLKRAGYTLAIADEVFFVQGHTWGLVGKRTMSQYVGDHKTVPVFRCIT